MNVRRTSLLLAAAGAALAPSAAAAPTAELTPAPRDPSSCLLEDGAAPFWLCRVWSGSPLPANVDVRDDAGAPVVDGTTVQLFGRADADPATPWLASGAPRPTSGGRVALRLVPPRSRWYAAEADVAGTPAATAPLRVLVAARVVVPDDLGTQPGARFTIRGRVAFAGTGARGTLVVERCRRSDPRRCTDAADFLPPVARRAFRRRGAFAVTVRLPALGRHVFRLRYVPRDLVGPDGRGGFIASSRLVAIRYGAASTIARTISGQPPAPSIQPL